MTARSEPPPACHPHRRLDTRKAHGRACGDLAPADNTPALGRVRGAADPGDRLLGPRVRRRRQVVAQQTHTPIMFRSGCLRWSIIEQAPAPISGGSVSVLPDLPRHSV
jgi:hypothetical protein